MKMNTYILVGHKPIKCSDRLEWGKWMNGSNRKIAFTKKRKISVSTVFLGLDHSWSLNRKLPILFETLVFDGKYNGEINRYSTWDEAVQGHIDMCTKVFGKYTKKDLFIDML